MAPLAAFATPLLGRNLRFYEYQSHELYGFSSRMRFVPRRLYLILIVYPHVDQGLHPLCCFFSIASFIYLDFLYGELVSEYKFTMRMRTAKRSD